MRINDRDVNKTKSVGQNKIICGFLLTSKTDKFGGNRTTHFGNKTNILQLIESLLGYHFLIFSD